MKSPEFIKSEGKGLYIMMILTLSCFMAYSQQWDYGKKIVPNDRNAGDLFGWSVDIHGWNAIGGAYSHDYDTSGNNYMSKAGKVYFFEYSPTGGWVQSGQVVASDLDSLDYFGYHVAIDGNYAIVGAEQEDHDASGANYKSDAGSAYIFEKNTSGKWVQKAKIVAGDRAAGDGFGHRVGISGDYAIATAPEQFYDSNGTNSVPWTGAAYIFKRDTAGNWTQWQKIHAPVRAVGDVYGASVSIQGEWIIVGANLEDQDASEANYVADAGSAYLYKRNAYGKYIFKQKITASARHSSAHFGKSVALFSEYAVIGAYYEGYDSLENNFLSLSGAAYIFRKNASNVWVFDQKIVSNDRLANDWFGEWLDLSEDYIVVGSGNSYDANGQNFLSGAGSLYAFARNNNGNWVQEKKLLPSDRAAGDQFGRAVAIYGNTVIGGAQYQNYDPNGQNYKINAGAAYLFQECGVDVYNDSMYICAGDSVFLEGVWQKSQGIFSDTLTSAFGCDSVSRISLFINTGPVVSSVTHASRCGTGSVTLGATPAAGTIYWYSTSSGGSALSSGTSYTTGSLSSTTTYYAEAYDNGCPSATRTPVYAIVNAVPSITNTTATSVCDSGVVTLTASSTFGSINWFAQASGGTRIGAGSSFNTPMLLSTTNYWVDAMDSACVSARTMVTAFVYSTPTINTTAGASACDSGSLSLMATISAGTLKWYGGMTGGPVLGTNSPFVTPVISSTTTYFAEASANVCQSDRVPVVAAINHSTSSTQTVTSCFAYTSPLNNTYTKSGTYTELSTNTQGCDSMITLNLTIDTVDVSVSQAGPQLTANASGTYQWIDCNSGIAVSGAISQSFTATSNGLYAVIITQNSCTDTSSCHEVTGIGVENLDLAPGIKLYPNPTKGRVKVELDKNYERLSVNLFNASGELVKILDYSNVDFVDFFIPEASGLYFIELNTGINLIRLRLLKE